MEGDRLKSSGLLQALIIYKQSAFAAQNTSLFLHIILYAILNAGIWSVFKVALFFEVKYQ
jgi:hypothetical protein